MKAINEQANIRKYILGEIDDQQRAEIEELIMTDDDYFQKFSIVEEQLVQEYADNQLSAADRLKFEKCFLISDANRQRVKFARALRKYVDDNTATAAAETAEVSEKHSFFQTLKAFLSSPVPAALGILIVLAAMIFLVRQTFVNTDDSSVLATLNKIYQNDRPTTARITGFDYAPKIEGRRGNDKNESLELISAKSRATEAVLKNETPENLHELARLYLAENDFDEAIKYFEKAVKLSPDDAELHNDLGVALLEKAKKQDDGKLDNLSKANLQFSAAIALDKNLPAPYFNRALSYQLIPSNQSAIEAWQQYLKLDNDSQWADEAKKNLQELEDQKSENFSGDEIEEEYMQAFRQNDNQAVWQLISQTRELITEKYLPQRLAAAFVNAPEEKKKRKI